MLLPWWRIPYFSRFPDPSAAGCGMGSVGRAPSVLIPAIPTSSGGKKMENALFVGVRDRSAGNVGNEPSVTLEMLG